MKYLCMLFLVMMATTANSGDIIACEIDQKCQPQFKGIDIFEPQENIEYKQRAELVDSILKFMAKNYELDSSGLDFNNCFDSIQSIDLDDNLKTKEWLVANNGRCPLGISNFGYGVWIIVSVKNNNKVVLYGSAFLPKISIVSYNNFEYGKNFLKHIYIRGVIEGTKCYISGWFWEWDNHLKTYIKKLEVEKEHDEYCENGS